MKPRQLHGYRLLSGRHSSLARNLLHRFQLPLNLGPHPWHLLRLGGGCYLEIGKVLPYISSQNQMEFLGQVCSHCLFPTAVKDRLYGLMPLRHHLLGHL